MQNFERDAYRDMQNLKRRAGRDDSRYIERGDNDNPVLARIARELESSNSRPQGQDIIFGDTKGKNIASYNHSGYANMPSISSGLINFSMDEEDVIGKRIAQMNRDTEIDGVVGQHLPIRRSKREYDNPDEVIECPRCKGEMVITGSNSTHYSYACTECGCTNKIDRQTNEENTKEAQEDLGQFVRTSKNKKVNNQNTRQAHIDAWERWADRQANFLDRLGVNPNNLVQEVSLIQNWYDNTRINIEDYSLEDALYSAEEWNSN